MQVTLYVIQVILAVFITTTILLQAKGSSLGTTWGGGGETYHTRRGIEKAIFYASIIAVALFILNSIALLVT
ncbi:MAG: preprotein translocase subunit SecG [bacterium]|nr:preprotein translocase subunit SecG [bacterium]